MGIHFYDMDPNFQLYIMYSVKFGIIVLRVAVFVKIPFQHITIHIC